MSTPLGSNTTIIALAAGAHPDDIEFMMAGTLLLLKEAGAEIHMWNLADGYCGSDTLDSDTIKQIRWKEAQASAHEAGAAIHPPITEDIAVMYDLDHIKKAAAVIRTVKPAIMLVPSPQDYMEDHQNACRVLVTAAFVKGIRNFITTPPVDPWLGSTTLYHAMPHGLCDSLRKHIRPGQYIDITPVMEKKRTLLMHHHSQKEWLDVSQGMDSYIHVMESLSREVGVMSGRLKYAEGWRRHSHIGFSPDEIDSLSTLLGEACWTDPEYEQSLKSM